MIDLDLFDYLDNNSSKEASDEKNTQANNENVDKTEEDANVKIEEGSKSEPTNAESTEESDKIDKGNDQKKKDSRLVLSPHSQFFTSLWICRQCYSCNSIDSFKTIKLYCLLLLSFVCRKY